MRQRLSSPSCTQRTPAGLPSGMPGIGLVIEGAVQQAPQLSLHCMVGKERTQKKGESIPPQLA